MPGTNVGVAEHMSGGSQYHLSYSYIQDSEPLDRTSESFSHPLGGSIVFSGQEDLVELQKLRTAWWKSMCMLGNALRDISGLVWSEN